MHRFPLAIGILLTLSLLMTACRRQDPEAVKQAARDKVAAIAAGTQRIPGDAATPSGDTVGNPAPGVAADSIPQTISRFSHPIDNIPEGLKYREAVSAADRGDVGRVNAIREELSKSEQYRPLADALEGLLLVKQDDFAAAIAIAENISAVPVMQAEAYMIAAEVFQRQNRLNEAIGAMASALEINPQYVRAHLLIGAVYYDTGAMRLATTHLRQAADLDEKNVNALLLSGKIHNEYEQYAEAIVDYTRALERIQSPELEVRARVDLATCLCELRKLDEAKQAIESCPEVPAVMAVRSLIAEAAGEFDVAAEQASEALQLSPRNRTAALVLARTHVTQRNWSDAIALLEPWTREEAYDHEMRLLYGRALVGSGDQDRGRREVEQATELKDTFLKFADMHQEAITQPTDSSIRIELGKLAEKLGKKQLAATWYQAALGLAPDNQEAASLLRALSSN